MATGGPQSGKPAIRQSLQATVEAAPHGLGEHHMAEHGEGPESDGPAPDLDQARIGE